MITALLIATGVTCAFLFAFCLASAYRLTGSDTKLSAVMFAASVICLFLAVFTIALAF
ncbi:MAG: hypothetical protein PF636_10085 [Actinomycetota bacterium]|jgi:hypothetical protein|nr:hypothetical protein [Actinomycetota bacterium]